MENAAYFIASRRFRAEEEREENIVVSQKKGELEKLG